MVDSLLARARRALAVVRLRPIDVSTQEGRSQERYRRVLLSTAASALARGLVILIGFVSLPLTVNYLGAERFGLWATITSLAALIAFADLGIGNGLINAVADASGRDDHDAARRIVSTGFFLLLAVAALLALAFALAYPLVPWARLFNVTSPEAAREAGPAVAVFVACFVAGLPLGVVQKVQIGYQEGFASSLWQCLGGALGLAGLLAVIEARAGLPWLVLALSGGPLVALALSWAAVFGRQRPWLRPSPAHLTRAWARRITGLGWLFFVLQVSGAVAFASDTIVIARVLGPDMVAEYAVPAKLFTLAPVVVGMALNPLWPAYGEAAARGDMGWVRRAFGRSLAVSLLVSLPLALLLVLLGAQIIALWVGPQIAPSLPLLLGFGAWAVVASVAGVVAMLLNGLSVLGFQAATAVLTAAAAIVMKVALARQAGVDGVIWASVVASLVCTLVPSALYIPRLLAGPTREGRAAP